MSTLSTTYDQLRTVAARALGWDRSALSAADESHLNEIPNLAATELARGRGWPYLRKQCVLTPTTNQPFLLLPADFDNFVMEQELNYGPSASYAALCWRDAAWIEQQRSFSDLVDVPRCAAMGGTLDELTTATATPAGSGSFSGTYSYRWRHVSSDNGVVTLSTIVAAAPSSKTHVTVAGWPTTPGTVSIYRTTSGGTSLRLITAASALAAASVSSYNDSTADGSLSTTTFPDSASSSDTLLGRRILLLWPTPNAALPLYGYYRRMPRTMSAGTDTPDVTGAMIPALREYTKIVALRERNREIPPTVAGEFGRLESLAWQSAGIENPSNGAPLRDIRGNEWSGPVGRNMTLRDRSTW